MSIKNIFQFNILGKKKSVREKRKRKENEKKRKKEKKKKKEHNDEKEYQNQRDNHVSQIVNLDPVLIFI